MKKHLLFSILAIALLAVSCEKDEATATTPVLGELTLSPSTVYQGDQITAKVKISDEGKNCDFFNFKVSYNDRTITISKTDLTRDAENNMEFYFTAPKLNGKLNVSVFATATLYAGSQLYKTTNTVKSSVTILEKE